MNTESQVIDYSVAECSLLSESAITVSALGIQPCAICEALHDAIDRFEADVTVQFQDAVTNALEYRLYQAIMLWICENACVMEYNKHN